MGKKKYLQQQKVYMLVNMNYHLSEEPLDLQ